MIGLSLSLSVSYCLRIVHLGDRKQVTGSLIKLVYISSCFNIIAGKPNLNVSSAQTAEILFNFSDFVYCDLAIFKRNKCIYALPAQEEATQSVSKCH